MSEWTFIGAAYALTWVVLAGYAASLARRWTRARLRLERIRDNGESVQ